MITYTSLDETDLVLLSFLHTIPRPRYNQKSTHLFISRGADGQDRELF